MTLGPVCLRDFRERIMKKEGYYKCEDPAILSIMGGHLQQLMEKLTKEGIDRGLQLLFRMITFSENFDNVYFVILMPLGTYKIYTHHDRKLHAEQRARANQWTSAFNGGYERIRICARLCEQIGV